MVSTGSDPSASLDHCKDRWLNVGTGGPAKAEVPAHIHAAIPIRAPVKGRRHPLFTARFYGRARGKSSGRAVGFELLHGGHNVDLVKQAFEVARGLSQG